MQDITPQPNPNKANSKARIIPALARHFGEMVTFEVLPNIHSRCGVTLCQEIDLPTMNYIDRLLKSDCEYLNSLTIIDSEDEKIRFI